MLLLLLPFFFLVDFGAHVVLSRCSNNSLVIDGEMRSRLLFLIEEGEKTSNDAITLVSPKRKSSLPRKDLLVKSLRLQARQQLHQI